MRELSPAYEYRGERVFRLPDNPSVKVDLRDVSLIIGTVRRVEADAMFVFDFKTSARSLFHGINTLHQVD
jgi:hypothetical protein